jgi:hypothetical protein
MNYRTSHQSISWFNQRRLDKSLTLAPPFQRRPVWVTKQKQYLIDTILNNLPVPEIYIQRKTDTKGRTQYIVVDGQQRIRSIFDFIEGDFSLPEDLSSEWSDCDFSELTDTYKQLFWDYPIVVRELEQATDDDVRDLFKRLNKYVFALNAQELRNARYTGPFINLMTEIADYDYWAENRIVSATAIRRMNDIQYVSELFVAIMHGVQHKTKTLDRYYEMYEENFPDIAEWKSKFIRTMEIIKYLFPEIKETRWHNRSDYYSLFVAISQHTNDYVFSDNNMGALSRRLTSFGKEVDEAVKKEGRSKDKIVTSYAKAVIAAAADRDRRLIRHEVLSKIIEKYIPRKRKNQHSP